MSGKLIMKRKLDRCQQHSNNNNKLEVNEPSAPTTSPSNSRMRKNNIQNNKNEDTFDRESKRIRCDTPPPEPADIELPPLPQVSEQNRRLLETIQLKILELQNELDAFEHDVEAREEDNYDLDDPQHNLEGFQMSEQDAESLGFAMCAQETILFMQREGIPSDSLLYTRLCDALIGRP